MEDLKYFVNLLTPALVMIGATALSCGLWVVVFNLIPYKCGFIPKEELREEIKRCLFALTFISLIMLGFWVMNYLSDLISIIIRR